MAGASLDIQLTIANAAEVKAAFESLQSRLADLTPGWRVTCLPDSYSPDQHRERSWLRKTMPNHRSRKAPAWLKSC